MFIRFLGHTICQVCVMGLIGQSLLVFAQSRNLEKLETQFGEKLPFKTSLILNISGSSHSLKEIVKLSATLETAVNIAQKPQGTVTFTDNGKKICKNVPLNSTMHATCEYQVSKLGAHVVRATYNGQKDLYMPSAASTVYYAVKMPAQFSLHVTPETDSFGQNDKLALTIINETDAQPLTGKFDYFVNTRTISGCQKLKAQDMCTYTVQKNDGALEFSALYSGDVAHNNANTQKAFKKTNGLKFEFLPAPKTILKNGSRENNIQLLYDAQASQAGLDFSFKIMGNFNDENILRFKDQASIAITTIKPSQNYLLEEAGQSTDAVEFKSTECSISSENEALIASCKKFRPTSLNFDMTLTLSIEPYGAIASQTFPVKIKPFRIVQSTISNTVAPAAGCGLIGTTKQRMFDCSLYVSNFGGYIDPKQNFLIYTPSSTFVENTWFLVNCPSGKSVPQSCSWLSPVLHDSNPALSKNEFDTNGVPMARYSGKRLLWSGVSKQSFKFFQANGNDSASNIVGYSEYPLKDETLMAKNAGATKNIAKNVCETGQGMMLFSSKAPYQWQLPSYPMLMTLTGGNFCSVNGIGYLQNWQAFCNGGNEPRGYNAILIPGFIKNYLWSSSIDTANNVPWIFNGTDGGVDVDTFENENYVRCVSTSW